MAYLRIHGTTRQQLIKVFTAIEKSKVLALAAWRFELFDDEALRRVHRNGHV